MGLVRRSSKTVVFSLSVFSLLSLFSRAGDIQTARAHGGADGSKRNRGSMRSAGRILFMGP